MTSCYKLTLHCDTLANIAGGAGLANILLTKRSECGPVDGVRGGTTDGSKGNRGGNLHGGGFVTTNITLDEERARAAT